MLFFAHIPHYFNLLSLWGITITPWDYFTFMSYSAGITRQTKEVKRKKDEYLLHDKICSVPRKSWVLEPTR